MKSKVKVAVVQESSVPFDAAATTEKACRLIGEAAGNGAEFVLFPEAFLGTYPKGLTFDAPVGQRLPEGRDEFLRYFQGAVELNGPELRQIEKSARQHNVFVVLGIVERGGSTLYCAVVYFDPKRGRVGTRRKLMPTAAERLIWGFGDGSTLDVIESDVGKTAAVVCWENYMPALRSTMYAQGVEIYCAPTADDRPTWLSSMQHIALEGRCYVLSAAQFIRRREFGDNYRSVLVKNPDEAVMRGGSVIVGPLGEILAGPVFDEATVLYAELDNAKLVKSKMDFDPIGHYARPDIFSLKVDRGAKCAVHL
ncbi:MAG: carbon-nitrogen hydrolase family protein [Opitutaceae bacterium]|nr:carbon-nitrogen hydrolase family protein [Opitutaceae bacterium]